MKNLCFILLILCSCKTYSQFKFNGDFEELDKNHIPKGWLYSLSNEQKKAYSVVLDSVIKQSGRYSILIEKKGEESSFAAINYSINEVFEGSEIELRGFIKTENVKTGYAGLWLRQDGKNVKPVAFDNMNNRGAKGTTDWTLYSIKLPYKANEIKTLHIGGLLSGDGKAWFDHFEILIDNKPISKAKIKEILITKADLDTAFIANSRIENITLTDQLTTNLALAGQFWGFLKYHHPAIAKGDYNWDAELFRLLPSVLEAKNNQELSNVLEKFLDKLPQPTICKSCKKITEESYKITPNYGSLLDKTILQESLVNKLVYIQENRNIDNNYYLEMARGVRNPIFQNEKPYANMVYPDAGYRILSLYRYWTMINYFFPYKDVIGQDWNAVLRQSLPEFINAKDAMEYSKAVLKVIAKVNDTHANLWSGSQAINDFKGKLAAPFQAKFIQDQLVITSLHTDTLDVKSKLKVGDVILSIQNKDVKDLIKEYLPFTPASNYETQLRDLPTNFLLRSNETAVKIKVKRADQIFDYVIPMGKQTLIYKNTDFEKAVPFKLINEDLGYVFPGKYKNSMLPDIKKLFVNTKGIIVDMRCYPSEFMPFTFGNYIKSIQSPFVKFTRGNVTYPGAFNFSPDINNGEKSRDNYKGKVVVIVNSTSQSQAEYTTMAFQSAPNVKVIGSITAGADGNVSRIVLPGGLNTMISGIGVFYPNGTPTQRVGVKIDTTVYPTIKGITEGKDELLEKAIEILNMGW